MELILVKAFKKKPAGHAGYTRRTASGKTAVIKEKPYAKIKDKVKGRGKKERTVETTIKLKGVKEKLKDFVEKDKKLNSVAKAFGKAFSKVAKDDKELTSQVKSVLKPANKEFTKEKIAKKVDVKPEEFNLLDYNKFVNEADIKSLHEAENTLKGKMQADDKKSGHYAIHVTQLCMIGQRYYNSKNFDALKKVDGFLEKEYGKFSHDWSEMDKLNFASRHAWLKTDTAVDELYNLKETASSDGIKKEALKNMGFIPSDKCASYLAQKLSVIDLSQFSDTDALVQQMEDVEKDAEEPSEVLAEKYKTFKAQVDLINNKVIPMRDSITDEVKTLCKMYNSMPEHTKAKYANWIGNYNTALAIADKTTKLSYKLQGVANYLKFKEMSEVQEITRLKWELDVEKQKHEHLQSVLGHEQKRGKHLESIVAYMNGKVKRGDPSPTMLLGDCLMHGNDYKDTEMQEVACEVLGGEQGSYSDIKPLQKALKNRDATVREKAKAGLIFQLKRFYKKTIGSMFKNSMSPEERTAYKTAMKKQEQAPPEEEKP